MLKSYESEKRQNNLGWDSQMGQNEKILKSFKMSYQIIYFKIFLIFLTKKFVLDQALYNSN